MSPDLRVFNWLCIAFIGAVLGWTVFPVLNIVPSAAWFSSAIQVVPLEIKKPDECRKVPAMVIVPARSSTTSVRMGTPTIWQEIDAKNHGSTPSGSPKRQ